MFLCEVTGTVVAPKKSQQFRTAKLLIVHPVDMQGKRVGQKDMLALEPGFGAGVGDYVLVAREGAVVAQLMPEPDVPTNVVILGVVDNWTYEGVENWE